jgi:hypothetical protein
MRRVRLYDQRHPSAQTQQEQESRAYLLIEELRLRCERLDGTASDGWLTDLHREVGLAGLSASSRIPGWSRKVLLEAARTRSEPPMRGAPDADTELEIALGRARTAVELCLSLTEPVDHMHMAHGHLLVAMDLLGFHRLNAVFDLDQW